MSRTARCGRSRSIQRQQIRAILRRSRPLYPRKRTVAVAPPNFVRPSEKSLCLRSNHQVACSLAWRWVSTLSRNSSRSFDDIRTTALPHPAQAASPPISPRNQLHQDGATGRSGRATLRSRRKLSAVGVSSFVSCCCAGTTRHGFVPAGQMGPLWGHFYLR